MSLCEDPIREPSTSVGVEDEFYLSPARLAQLSTQELFLRPLSFSKKPPMAESGRPDSKAGNYKAG